MNKQVGLLVEHGDGARHTYDDQGLARQHREDYGAEDRCQEYLVDTVVHVGLGEHVEGESQRGQDAAKVLSVTYPPHTLVEGARGKAKSVR